MPTSADDLEREVKHLRDAFNSFTEVLLKLGTEQGERVQAGTAKLSRNAYDQSTRVDFPRRFPATPVVVVSALGSSGNSTDADVRVNVVDETGFTCGHANVQYADLSVAWIATLP